MPLPLRRRLPARSRLRVTVVGGSRLRGTVGAFILVLAASLTVALGAAPSTAQPGTAEPGHETLTTGDRAARGGASATAEGDRRTDGTRARKVRVVTYPDNGVTVRRASGQLGRLHKTSSAFRGAVKGALDELWRQAGSRPECRRAPAVIVKRWRSDGWARIDDIGVFAPCPSGGNWEIWRLHGQRRTIVLGGQDQPTCRQLQRKDVPANIWDRCWDGQELVPYRAGAAARRASGGVRDRFESVAGTYYGHTRSMRIRASGRMHVHVDSGCCDPVSTIDYKLSHLHRDGARRTARATITRVEYYNPDYFDRAPAKGQVKKVRIKHDVVWLGSVNFCGAAAPVGFCGA